MGLFDRGIHGREREGRERERDTLTHPLTHTYTDTYTYTHPLTHTHRALYMDQTTQTLQ